MMPDQLLTIREAAEYCGLTAHVVRLAIRRGRLPVHSAPTVLKMGSPILIAERDLNTWIEQRTRAKPRKPPSGRHSHSWAALVQHSRRNQGLAMHDVAARSGLCPSYISLMENGVVPKRPIVIRVAEALGLDVNHCLLACEYSPLETISKELLQVIAKLSLDEQTALARTLIEAGRDKDLGHSAQPLQLPA